MNPNVTIAYAVPIPHAPTTAGDVSYRPEAKQDQSIMYLNLGENCGVMMKRVADRGTASERRQIYACVVL